MIVRLHVKVKINVDMKIVLFCDRGLKTSIQGTSFDSHMYAYRR